MHPRPVRVRPMAAADVEPSVAVWLAAIDGAPAPTSPGTPGPADAARQRIAARVHHFLLTDPRGSWVATDTDDRVIGLAQSFVRESYVVLSLLGVVPSAQSAGAGGALLERSLAHGAGLRGTIQASLDPRAVRLCARAGFELHPSMGARGIAAATAAPPGVRAGGVSDLGLAADIDRAVRGAARTADLRHLIEHDGAVLLLHEDRAYAIVKPDRVITLAGRDEASASRVLAGALAQAEPDGVFEVGWLTSAQQWAVPLVLAAGLSLHPRGPVMVRGMAGPPRPCIPSGGFG